MQIIEIYHQGQVERGDFEILVNDHTPAEVSFLNNVIIIGTELSVGIHELRLIQIGDGKIEITQVKINKCSLRENIFLSYGIDGEERIQPLTATYKKNMTWVLPFGFPVSYWHDLVLRKFPRGSLCGDLYSRYDIYYPKSMSIPKFYPQIIKDFFAHDLDFAVVDRNATNYRSVPRVETQLLHPDTTALMAAVDSHVTAGDFHQYLTVGSQDDKNIVDDPNWTSQTWRYWMFQVEDLPAFPELKEFIELNQIQDIHCIRVSFLNPHGYIYPHRDPEITDELAGACQFYVPLNFEPGNWFKQAGVGAVDNGLGTYSFNVSQFTHAIINTTDQVRVALIIRCNIGANQHLVK